ncbi:hypothetical protein D9545_13440, partial [Geobacillus stearothermophilus]
YVFCWQAKRSIEFFPLPRAFSMTEMPYLCWAFLYTSTGVNSYPSLNTLPASLSQTAPRHTSQPASPVGRQAGLNR